MHNQKRINKQLLDIQKQIQSLPRAQTQPLAPQEQLRNPPFNPNYNSNYPPQRQQQEERYYYTPPQQCRQQQQRQQQRQQQGQQRCSYCNFCSFGGH